MTSSPTLTQPLEIYEERFTELVPPDAELERLADCAQWSEGPVYLPADDAVVWSDVEGNCLYRWSPQEGVSTWLQPSNYQNGHSRDPAGRIVACSHGERGILRQEADGNWHLLVDHFRGKRLNSPNDVTVKSDGTIWFTDPSFGLTQPEQGYGGQQEQPGSFVYRYDPDTDELTAVITEMERPNGLTFSPDESYLYVSDTSAHEHPQLHRYVRRYPVIDGCRVGLGKVFAEVSPGEPDGIRCDRQGHLFACAQDGVHIFDPDGTCLGKIRVPHTSSNITFGGPNCDQLFIAATNCLYRISLNTQGSHC